MPTKTVKRNSSEARRTAAKPSRSTGAAAKARSNHHSRLKAKPLSSSKLKNSAKPNKVKSSAARVVVRPPVIDEKHAAAVRNFEAGLHLEQPRRPCEIWSNDPLNWPVVMPARS